MGRVYCSHLIWAALNPRNKSKSENVRDNKGGNNRTAFRCVQHCADSFLGGRRAR